ncbi:LOB domain-containing protein 4-like [Henckelia pumila]|uniref:LOB domain-containing protein 4-like n=1 Tax=Henckelia pumila TaxID=405737 RepID=UPI003C6DF3BB
MAHQNCAACTYRRKRCGPDCVFAPYFPAEKAEEFEKVNWLFGGQNTMNMLNSVTEEERSRTAETLVIEASIRRENPVHGPLETEKMLREQIEMLQKEMEIVQRLLHLHKSTGDGKDIG